MAWPRALALVSLLACSHATAQSMRPSAAEWRAAEAALRDHHARAGDSIVDVARRDARPMGTTFWVRWNDRAGAIHGQLEAVREGAVIEGTGEAVLAAMLRADRFVERASWSAADLAALVRDLRIEPPLPATMLGVGVDTGGVPRFLRPRLERADGSVRLVLHAYTGEGPPEAPRTRRIHVARATMTVDAQYRITWASERLVLDERGDPLR